MTVGEFARYKIFPVKCSATLGGFKTLDIIGYLEDHSQYTANVIRASPARYAQNDKI